MPNATDIEAALLEFTNQLREIVAEASREIAGAIASAASRQRQADERRAAQSPGPEPPGRVARSTAKSLNATRTEPTWTHCHNTPSASQ